MRPNTQDEAVFAEVVPGNQYRLPERFGPEEVILDIGAHIGCFAFAVYERGARRIWCLEPGGENYQLLKENVQRSMPEAGGIHLIHAACWGNDRLISKLQFSGYRPSLTACGCVLPGSQTFAHEHDPRMRVWMFDGLVSQFPRIRLVKLDCEGAEYSILYTSQFLDRIDEIVGESHVINGFGAPGPRPWAIADLTEFLASQGFVVTTEPEGTNTLFFARRPSLATEKEVALAAGPAAGDDR